MNYDELLEVIEGLPHTMKVPLRKMIKHAQKEHELLGLYRRRPLYVLSEQFDVIDKQIKALEKELEELK